MPTELLRLEQCQTVITLPAGGQGLHEITPLVRDWVEAGSLDTGLLTIFLRHTSASLLIQENADPDVQVDLDEFFRRLVPEEADWFRHTAEGPDDMPSHIKSALTQTHLAIPVAEGRLLLGTWQGIYLFEHRVRQHRRQIVLHLIGE